MKPKEALTEIVENGIELGAGDFVDVEALKVAAKALERQDAMKPIISGIGNYNRFECPNCHEKLVSRIDTVWISGQPYKHCPECGQKIDWEGTNDGQAN